MEKVIGIYKIIPNIESIIHAAIYHKFDFLINDQGEYTDEIYWDDLQNLALIEIQVFGEYSPKELLNIAQNHQAPYLEYYLDPTGHNLLVEADAIKTEGRRLCFFMHFLDISKPLTIGDHEILLPAMASLPKRLEPFTHFVPVD
ncbi:MAG: hypothetical protein AB9891_12665 [Anaerolineaceae bacterium]